MSKVTYVCCTNNRNQLQQMLRKGLPADVCPQIPDSSSAKCKRNILIINSAGKYTSAAQAYNQELHLHYSFLGDILIFVHQDIFFKDTEFEREVIRILNENPNQILGVAGMPEAGRTVSNLRYLKDDRYITCTQIDKITEVCSLDECCFAMTLATYEKIKFNEKICHHWHLYAVLFCYEARMEFNISSYVLPVKNVFHKYDDSEGLYGDRHFFCTLWKICRKYYRVTDKIYTPCCIIKTNILSSLYRIGKTLLKNAITK